MWSHKKRECSNQEPTYQLNWSCISPTHRPHNTSFNTACGMNEDRQAEVQGQIRGSCLTCLSLSYPLILHASLPSHLYTHYCTLNYPPPYPHLSPSHLYSPTLAYIQPTEPTEVACRTNSLEITPNHK